MPAKKLSKAKLAKYYTLEEARSIPGPFVYGLHDGHDIFYVGQTINAAGRFACYVRPKNMGLPMLRPLKRAGANLSVVILEHNPTDLDEAEKRHISALAPQLVNRAFSPVRMLSPVSPNLEKEMLRQQLATCPHCAGENFRHGKHKCAKPLDILTPRANPEMQGILREIGVIRG